MVDLKTIVRKYEVLRILCKNLRTFLGIGKALVVLWIPYIWKNPRRVKFLPQWLFSFRLEAAAFKDGVPWIPFEAAEWLDSYLTKNMIVFEYGSGGSTLFIAKRVKKLITVEHHPEWHRTISQLLKKENLSNCEYVLKEPKLSDNNLLDPSNPQSYFSSSKKYEGFGFEDYCKVIESYPDSSFDLVFIDGRARSSCISHALKKICPGGYLLLDDSNSLRYAKGIELLQGWERKDFVGPKLYMRQFFQTTIWQKKISKL